MADDKIKVIQRQIQERKTLLKTKVDPFITTAATDKTRCASSIIVGKI